VRSFAGKLGDVTTGEALTEGTKRPTVRDYAWAALGVLAVLLLTLSVFGTGWQLIANHDWRALFAVPIYLAFSYWVGVGAWRRTWWRRRSGEQP
jgi:predicted Na+-dependent transporter